jgi:hypothetical protein
MDFRQMIGMDLAGDFAASGNPFRHFVRKTNSLRERSN